MALTALNKRATSKAFFNDLPNDLIFKTATQIAHGAGRFVQENASADDLDVYPALELLRLYDRKPPETTWNARWQAACAAAGDDKAHRVFTKTDRMIALKSSGIWQALGDGVGGYEDSLGNPFPPFAFDSGFGQNVIDRAECEELGLLEPGQPFLSS